MTTQAIVSRHVSHGFAIVARNLGSLCQQYRPTGVGDPLATLHGTVMVAIDNAPGLMFLAPRPRAKPEDWYAACDLSLIQAGDYLVTPESETFFVAAVDFFSPARLVNCNAVVNIFRPDEDAPGDEYRGDDNLVPLATAWPCSIVQGTKGERGEVGLPSDTRLAWVSVLLPSATLPQLRMGDVLQDQQAIPARYTVSSTELTSLGWRLTAALATP